MMNLIKGASTQKAVLTQFTGTLSKHQERQLYTRKERAEKKKQEALAERKKFQEQYEKISLADLYEQYVNAQKDYWNHVSSDYKKQAKKRDDLEATLITKLSLIDSMEQLDLLLQKIEALQEFKAQSAWSEQTVVYQVKLNRKVFKAIKNARKRLIQAARPQMSSIVIMGPAGPAVIHVPVEKKKKVTEKASVVASTPQQPFDALQSDEADQRILDLLG
jgi:hypothetical protein